MKILVFFTAFLFGVIFILNPYTKLLPLSYLLLPLVISALRYNFKFISLDIFFSFLAMIGISLIGVLSSIYSDIFQIAHLRVTISLFFSFLIAYTALIHFYQKGKAVNDVIYISLLVLTFNSLIVLVEVGQPSVRSLIESFLAPSGNRDWSEGIRYRGIASGGGASLSLVIPIAFVLLLHLFNEKYIGIVQSAVLGGILILSALFIGRTGLVLLPVIIVLYVAFNFRKHFLKLILLLVLVILPSVLYMEHLKIFIIDEFGIGFYNYSVGFMLEGLSGFENEGTVTILLSFLQVLPASFPEILIGYGFYGGSEFEPWTDSGYARMFLSVGYLFGTLFYILFFFAFRTTIKSHSFVLVSLGVVLLIGEVKEPLLFSGYGSRIYILILVAFMLSDKQKVIDKKVSL